MTAPCRALGHFVRCNNSAKGSIKLPITLEFLKPSVSKDLQIRASCKIGRFAAAWLDLDHLAHEKGTGWLRLLPIRPGVQVAQVYLTNRSKIWFAGTEIEGILFRPPYYNRSAIAPLAPLLCTNRPSCCFHGKSQGISAPWRFSRVSSSYQQDETAHVDCAKISQLSALAAQVLT